MFRNTALKELVGRYNPAAVPEGQPTTGGTVTLHMPPQQQEQQQQQGGPVALQVQHGADEHNDGITLVLASCSNVCAGMVRWVGHDHDDHHEVFGQDHGHGAANAYPRIS